MNILTHNLLRILLIFFVLGTQYAHANNLKTLKDSLNRTIEHKQYFVLQKEERIKQIKQVLRSDTLSAEQEYNLNNALYKEYHKFNIDSAIVYVQRNIDIARTTRQTKKLYEMKLNLSLLYALCGMYREAESILRHISIKELPASLYASYYHAYMQFWEYYSASVPDNQRSFEPYESYRDSFLVYTDPSLFDSQTFKIGEKLATEPQQAEKELKPMLAMEKLGTPHFAILTYMLAIAYDNMGKDEERNKYLMMSAISDIRNATREHVALQTLAIENYQHESLSQIFKYIKSALDDAVAAGVHFRAYQIYQFYSKVSTYYQKEEANTQEKLRLYLLLVCICLILLIALTAYIYLQMRKIARIKEILHNNNNQLQLLNDELNHVNEELSNANTQLNNRNSQLTEINEMKEQYIAQFFDLCATYIDKMEQYQNEVYKLTINRHYEKLIKLLKSKESIDDELNALYLHFDTTFLNLYPTFITDFNALLKPGEQIILRQDNLLPKELRIYALLRLGIDDGKKMAYFLRCSSSTIYNYRTKMRNKAIDRDKFEQQVMQIGT